MSGSCILLLSRQPLGCVVLRSLAFMFYTFWEVQVQRWNCTEILIWTGSFEWYQYFLPKNQSCKLQKLESRLVRPWILFPYKSLKTQIALTLNLLLLWLSNCGKWLILGCSFTWCKLFIVFMFVYYKNKDTPLWIESIVWVMCVRASCPQPHYGMTAIHLFIPLKPQNVFWAFFATSSVASQLRRSLSLLFFIRTSYNYMIYTMYTLYCIYLTNTLTTFG